MIYYPDIIGYHGIDYAFINGINATALDLGGSVWGGNYVIPTTVLFTNTGPNMCYASIGQNVELLQPFSKTIIGGAGKADCFITGELYSKIRVDAYTYKITGAAKASLYDNTLNPDKFKSDVMCVIPFDSGPLTPANPDTIAGFPTRANRTVVAKLNTPLGATGYKGRGTEYLPQSFICEPTSLVITTTNTNYSTDPFKKMTVEFSIFAEEGHNCVIAIIAATNDYEYTTKFENGTNLASDYYTMKFSLNRINKQVFVLNSSAPYSSFNIQTNQDLTDFLRVALTFDFTKAEDNVSLFINGKFILTYTDFSFSSLRTNIKYFGVKLLRTHGSNSISNLRITENLRYVGPYANYVRSFRDLY